MALWTKHYVAIDVLVDPWKLLEQCVLAGPVTFVLWKDIALGGHVLG